MKQKLLITVRNSGINIFVLIFFFFLACEKPVVEPTDLVNHVKKPSRDTTSVDTPQRLIKWVYVGMEHDPEFFYNEECYFELYSDSTYINVWRGEEQQGTYSVEVRHELHTNLYRYTFSSPMPWYAFRERVWIAIEYNDEGFHTPFASAPATIQAIIEEMNLPHHILRVNPYYVSCVVGCDQYFVETRE